MSILFFIWDQLLPVALSACVSVVALKCIRYHSPRIKISVYQNFIESGAAS